ncbi:MAG: hypothetical protein Q9169_000055 [Polycauliona sp. 2 TL-2023]
MKMSVPTSPTSPNGIRSSTWQDRLQAPAPHPIPSPPSNYTIILRSSLPNIPHTDHCRTFALPNPIFSIVSDRRGGRTAWSSTVTISNQVIRARFWYDGQYVNNAKEDAAEVALQSLMAVGGGRREGGGEWRGGGM